MVGGKDGRCKALNDISLAGGANVNIAASIDIDAGKGRRSLEEESIDPDVADSDDVDAIKIIDGVRIDNDDPGGAYAEGSSRLCGSVDREIRGQSGQRGRDCDGATCPGLVGNIEDDEIGGGAIGGLYDFCNLRRKFQAH